MSAESHGAPVMNRPSGPRDRSPWTPRGDARGTRDRPPSNPAGDAAGPRDEVRLYGLNAVRAVFARRPDAIRKVYLAEARRVGPTAAGRSTRLALKAAGASILIDLAAALLATCVWVTGVVVA